jgi:hypothetical protein
MPLTFQSVRRIWQKNANQKGNNHSTTCPIWQGITSDMAYQHRPVRRLDPSWFMRFLARFMFLHGIKEGDVMHVRCPLCALWRQLESKRYHIKVCGIWRMPKEMRLDF